MVMRSITATQFKARCLALLDHVEQTGEPLVVTKRGKPVAQVVALEGAEPVSLEGSVTLLDCDDDLLSTGEPWDSERG